MMTVLNVIGHQSRQSYERTQHPASPLPLQTTPVHRPASPLRWARTHAAAAVAAIVVLGMAGSGVGIWWGKRVQRRGDEARRAEDAREDLLRKVGENLARARELTVKGDFGEALLRVETARSLKPDDPRVEQAGRDLRRARLVLCHFVPRVLRLLL